MNYEEYTKALNELYRMYVSNKKALGRQYVESIAAAKTGDIIEDMSGNLTLVEKIVVDMDSCHQYWFVGKLLKKNGYPRVDQKEKVVYPHFIENVRKQS
jgi:hypothetical protein